jgi:hypothetical protein
MVGLPVRSRARRDTVKRRRTGEHLRVPVVPAPAHETREARGQLRHSVNLKLTLEVAPLTGVPPGIDENDVEAPGPYPLRPAL